MITLTGYQIRETLYTGTRTIVYRAIRTQDNQPVIIKVLRNPHPNFNELVQFRNQYTITKHLSHPGIVQPLALERNGNGYALVMPDDGAIALSDYWQKCNRSLSEFLNIAIQLADALHYLNQQRIIHKDIKPANILICPETHQVQLIDFSISTLLPKEQQQLTNLNVLEGTLAYISPEQTGRMNRGIDYRTDFYSLGVTFYKLLTGKLPFETDDVMELVHCHIAKTPILGNETRARNPVSQRNRVSETTPQVLMDIVLKLMAKNAEDRYQSALGLKYDLEQCLQQWESTGKIDRFKLGEMDRCDRFTIPEKLYGRETEVAQLLAAFERVANPPQSDLSMGFREVEMMLVAGFSGIGKTAVINEVHKPIVKQRGYFIQGKFDQLQRNIPLSAFVQAFRDLMRQLLSESDAQLEQWKTRIIHALGENGQVIIEVIPELERIIGKQPKLAELSGSAAQNRFNFLFQKFIQVFATQEHPLVIFVDDLQWADAASLQLMQLLMASGETGYLLLLGAYRDNEVFPAHPLMLTLDAIRKSGAMINTITLNPLSQSDINRLVADTLKCELELAHPLTKLVDQKTQGNPFFVTQFLQGLHQDEWIVFNGNLGFWECDLTRVRELALSDDVVEFMATRLYKLPADTQEILKLAACIGNQFDLATLAMACDRPEEEVATALWRSLQEGLVLPLGETYKFFQDPPKSPLKRGTKKVDPPQSPLKRGTKKRDRISVAYKFLHDRVQQAAYSLIPDTEKQATHLKIGELLLNKIAPEEQQQNIFAIVNQLNMAIELIKEVSAQEKLARLNLMAGKKARASAAYQPAYNYLQIGLQVLREESWQEQYELSLSLYENATELAYLNGDFERMYELAAVLKEKAKTLLEQIKVYEILIQAYIAQNLLQEAIETGLNVVSKLGVNVPASPTHEELEAVLAEVGDRLGGTALENLVNLPPMTDTKQLAILRILSSIYAPSFMTAPLLCLLTVAKQVAISIEYGNTPQSAFAYGNYGVILCGIFMDIDLGYQFGDIALELLEKLNVNSFKGKTIMTVNICVKPWKEAISKTLPALLEAYTSALEVGDLEFAGYSAVIYCYHCYAAGKQLEVLAEEMATYGGQVYQLKQRLALNNLSPFHQAVLNLQGKGTSDKPWVLLGEIFNEPKTLPSLQKANDRLSLFYFYVNKIYLCYLFEAYSEAVKEAALGDLYLNAAMASPMVAIFNFYDSLSRLAIYPGARDSEKDVLWSRVAANQEKMLLWAEKAPMNFQHKYDLVEAELNRVLGQKIEAIELYERAISGAKENGYVQEEALANELAAKFYLDWDKEKISATYMIDAYYCYARWGAQAKTDQLLEKYPQLLAPILQKQEMELNQQSSTSKLNNFSQTWVSSTYSQSSTGLSETLDVAALLQAAGAVSSQLKLNPLLAEICRIILINAGAQKAVLLTSQDDQWQLRAIAHISSDGTIETKTQSQTLTTESPLPIRLIQYVTHTEETVLINEAKTEIHGILEGDLLADKPQSVLCVPLLNQGCLVAILYLEHPTTKGIFTPSRQKIVEFLCTQAAISLQNAQLYEQAQQVLTDLQQTQLQLVQSEKMSALGNLVAGVAHEINNPVGFLQGNIQPAQEYLQDLLELIDYLLEKCPKEAEREILDKLEELDFDFMRSDFPELLGSMNQGVERIKSISQSLRTFSRQDREQKTLFKIDEGIESTLLILKHRTKASEQRPALQIIKDYQEIPEVPCFPGQLNQVFMNILANAIDAFDEANIGKNYCVIKENPNQINISISQVNENQVQIQIKDNGCGMTPETQARIFEQGFTTKGVGKGTGLGMAIAHQIITEKHGGTIECDSELGKGTTFIITLPIS